MLGWTEEQKEAIWARNRNLLITASAGSGKTAVLVERIIQLICRDGVDLDRLLIVTFTNAAAAEMRSRISTALLAELDKAGDNQEHLRRQMNLLSHSSISTLHAFCTEIVRKHFYLLEIDPNFRIANTTETDLIKMELVEELFEEEYQKNSECFLGLVEMFGASTSDLPFQDLFLRSYEFMQSQPYPLRWFRESVANFNLDESSFAGSPWLQALSRDLQIKLQAARDVFGQALQLTELTGGPQTYRAAIFDDLQLVQQLGNALRSGISTFYEHIKDLKHKKLARIPKSDEVDPSLQEEVKSLRDDGKKLIDDMRDLMMCSPGEYLDDLHRLYPFMDYLAVMLNDFSQRYQDRKAEKGILDFNDLEHMALQVLTHDAVAAEYRNHYLYMFVDEYQDSNLVQETILDFIKNDDNLFLVGDVKQSIYRFRLADPSLFIAKREKYSKSKDALHRRIDLNSNFRSNCEIINGVNYIFTRIMSREFGELDYDEDSRLYPGLEELDEPVRRPVNESEDQDSFAPVLSREPELYIIENSLSPREESVTMQTNNVGNDGDFNDTGNDHEDIDNIELEARLASKRIKELCESQIYDRERKSWRKVNYRDIVILMRASRNAAAVFLEHFLREGIPVYAEIEKGYFETLEIELFINLLRLIDNQNQDIPLLSVLRSPIANLSIEELISIRLECPRGQNQISPFYEAVKHYAENQKDDLAVKLKVFLNKLREWKSEALYMPMDELIWKLFVDTGYYYYVGAMPGGEQRQANLRILYDRARQFQTTSIRGLFSFLKFVEKLRASKGDMGNAMIIGERDNVVRIMSIHKSKGLEFPVVILAGMGKKFNLRDTTSPILLHRDLGLGPRLVDPVLRTRRDTIARLVMKNVIKMESLAEEMRILYVAMTRPQSKLIMLGTIRNMDNCRRKWSKSINAYNLSRGGNYLDWLGTALIRHIDGQAIRDSEFSSIAVSLIGDQSRWKIEVVDTSSLIQEELLKVQKMDKIRELLEGGNHREANSDEFEVVWEQLNWEYPFSEAALIPSKISVTTLKNLQAGKLEGLRNNIASELLGGDLKELNWDKETILSGAQKGTIIHFIMQNLDYSRLDSLKVISEQISVMVENELLTEEAAAAIDIGKIENFFASPLGQRVLAAEKIYREVPFNLRVDAGEIIDGLESAETMLIQGVIDLYFQEGEELVLVDYKSDWLVAGQEADLAARYHTQLEWYKKALERIQGRTVKESYLYLFHTDQAILV
ncbi:MAG: UvrD-helicase domain-containing protein [Syntrophomonas sp.]